MRRSRRIPLATFLVLTLSLLVTEAKAQDSRPDDTRFFNEAYWNGLAEKRKLSVADKKEFIESHRHEFENPQSSHSELVWVTTYDGRKLGGASVASASCTNVDFEQGSLTGWVRSTGYNPLYNAVGCCTTANGAQAIVTGTALDTYGGFPQVCPGGTYSAKLGNNQVNGTADRLEQTFFVTSQNAYYILKYAVVLNDAGHYPYDQAAFTIEIVDTLGQPATCTNFSMVAGAYSPGMLVSSVSGGMPADPVQYIPWTTAVIDLSSMIGNNVTIRLTTYDCSLGGHFGYAYIDGQCSTTLAASGTNTVCGGIPGNLCAPLGFASYSWNGPGITTATSNCTSVGSAGVYTCTTLLYSGCPGPTFIRTVTASSSPIISFTPVSANPCATQFTFNSSSSVSSGSIASLLWSFGDAGTASTSSPSHSYAGIGTYTVKLKAVSDQGCRDSVSQAVTINPVPTASFSAVGVCLNSLTQFTNNSFISAGSITGYSWSLGNGTSSTVINPALTYTTPGVYTVTLIATSNAGCTSQFTNAVVVNPLPVAAFSVSGLCFGNTTQFANLSSVATGSLSGFNWTFGTSFTSTASSPAVSYTAPGTYYVSHTVTSNQNCSSSTTQYVTINPLPPVTASTSNASICNGGSVTLTASGANAYMWSTQSTSSLQTVTPTVSTIYTVTGSNQYGCVNTATVAITVYSLPVVAISPATSTICPGQSITLSVSGAAYYIWIGSSSGQSVTLTPSGTTVYTVTGGSLNNCFNTATASVLVNNTPTITVNPAATAVCIGQSAVLTASGASLYAWSNQQAGPTITVTPPSTTSYSVIGTDANSCTNTAVSMVTVYPLPSVTAITSPSALCSGGSATLTASGASTYQWSNQSTASTEIVTPLTNSIYSVTGSDQHGCINTTTVSVVVYSLPVIVVTPATSTICAGQNVTLSTSGAAVYVWNGLSFGQNATFTPVSSVVYTVVGTDQNNCSSNANATVIVNQGPSLTLTPLTASVCAGESMVLTASGAPFYLWSNNIVGPTVTVQPLSNTSYTVTGLLANGCSNTAVSTVSVYPTPIVTASASSNFICIGKQVTLSASGANTYSWSNSTNGQTISITPTVSSVFTVTGTAVDLCFATDQVTVTVDDCTGLNKFDNDPKILVYPNPAVDAIFVLYPPSERFSIVVYNSLGQLVMEKNDLLAGESIRLEAISAGVYYVDVRDRQMSTIVKLIVN